MMFGHAMGMTEPRQRGFLSDINSKGLKDDKEEKVHNNQAEF